MSANFRRLSILLGFAALMGLSAVNAALAVDLEQRVDFNISPGRLSDALVEFSKQAHVQVLASGEGAASASTDGISGEQAVGNALRELLKSSGFEFEVMSETAIAVREKSGARSGAVAPPTRDAMRLAQVDGAPSDEISGDGVEAAKQGEHATTATSSENESGLQEKLEEIVVTAQKREERLKDVPISISVLSGESLERGTITSMNDALRNVPGFAGYENTQGALTRYSVRGVSTNSSLLNSSSVVGFYLDEIPFGFVRFPVVPDTNAYDVERVEALRGPQGTLYGANSLNGVIRIMTEDAHLEELEFKMRTSMSSTQDGEESYRGDVAVNVPLIAGKLALRAVGGYEDAGGWVDLPNAGIKDANDRQTQNLRLKVNAQPVENLGIEFLNWFSRTDRGNAANSRDDRTAIATSPSNFETNFDAHGLALSYEFPFASLVSSTSRMTFDSAGASDFGIIVSEGPVMLWSALEAELLSQEVRLTSTSEGPWKWSAGGIYRDEEDKFIQEVLVEQTLADWSQIPTRQLYNSESYAFFGELSRSFLGNRLELTGGVRYFHDTNVSDEPTAYSPVTGAPVTPAGRSPTVKSDALTSRVVLTYRRSEATSFYASFGEGFRPGFPPTGTVLRLIPPEAVSFLPVVEPDKLKNYELGAKGSAFGGILSYDLAAYYIDWKDAVQVQRYIAPFFDLFVPLNSEGVDGVGADAGITLRLANRWRLGATVSWNDLQFTDTVVNQTANGPQVLFPKGARPPESSEMTAGGDISYRFPLGEKYSAEFVGAANYTSKLVTAGATGLTTGDDLTRVNASFTLNSSSGWSATLFGDNLTDEDGKVRPVSLVVGSAEFDRLRPRTYGLQLEYKFH